jgi:hypothetical protein
MGTVTTSEESERQLAEALRARATGAGGPPVRPPGSRARSRRAAAEPMRARTALLLALAGGILLGALLALLSLLDPTLLPPIG